MNNKNECECDGPGYCQKFGLVANEKQWKHCREFLHLVNEKHSNISSKPLPSLFQQAKNFSASLVNHITNGAKRLKEEDYQQRLSICNQCEEKRSDNRCAKCGCSVLTKAKWASSECPLKKWLPQTQNQAETPQGQDGVIK